MYGYVIPRILRRQANMSMMSAARAVVDRRAMIEVESHHLVRWALTNVYGTGCLFDLQYVFHGSPIGNYSPLWESVFMEGVISVDTLKPYSTGSLVTLPRNDDIRDKRIVLLSRVDETVLPYERDTILYDSLHLFKRTIDNEACLNWYATTLAMTACGLHQAIEQGRSIHGFSLRSGCSSCDLFRIVCLQMYAGCDDMDSTTKLSVDFDLWESIFPWNLMIVGHLRCGCKHSAEELFDLAPKEDIVCWDAMILSHAHHGQFKEALSVYQEREKWLDTEPDKTTLAAVIKACTYLNEIEEGQRIHQNLKEINGHDMGVPLGDALIDMYTTFGLDGEAETVFYDMEEKGISTWNAIILGFSRRDTTSYMSLVMFKKMERHGMLPDEETFKGFLNACRRLGLVDIALYYLNFMFEEYGIKPNLEHYWCLVQLLGREGYVEEAQHIIEKMPMASEVVSWGELFHAALSQQGLESSGQRPVVAVQIIPSMLEGIRKDLKIFLS